MAARRRPRLTTDGTGAVEPEVRDRLAGLDRPAGRSGGASRRRAHGPAETTTTSASRSSSDSTRASSRDPQAARERAARPVGVHDPGVGLEEHERAAAAVTPNASAPPPASSSSHPRRTRSSASCELTTPSRKSSSSPFSSSSSSPLSRLELAPAGERLLREPHPLRLRIREPEDPRPAVARPALVPELELLVDDDVVRPRGAAPRRSRARSRPLRRPRRQPRRTVFRSTPIPSTSSSTTSPCCSQRPSPCSRMQPVPTVPEPSTSPG